MSPGLKNSAQPSSDCTQATSRCNICRRHPKRLLLLTDVAGVLDKDGQLLQQLTIEQARRLIREGIINGGMIPKVEGCIEVVEAGVEAVVILDGRVAHCVLLELFTEHGVGTMVAGKLRKAG